MEEALREIDVAAYLDDAEDIRLYLEEVVRDGDLQAFSRALRDVARACLTRAGDHQDADISPAA